MAGILHSEVFLREDVAAILSAIALTAARNPQPGLREAAYRRGFADGLAAVAIALHISPAELTQANLFLEERQP